MQQAFVGETLLVMTTQIGERKRNPSNVGLREMTNAY